VPNGSCLTAWDGAKRFLSYSNWFQSGSVGFSLTWCWMISVYWYNRPTGQLLTHPVATVVGWLWRHLYPFHVPFNSTFYVYRQLSSYSDYDGLITAIFISVPCSIPHYAFYWQPQFSTNIVAPLIVCDVIFLLQTSKSTLRLVILPLLCFSSFVHLCIWWNPLTMEYWYHHC